MKTYTGTAGLRANCFTCGKQWQSKNALAVAANHARKHKHEVAVEFVRMIRFNGAED